MIRVLPKTYFALDPNGTFRETNAGRQSYDIIVDDILTGQYEVDRVYCAFDGKFTDVTPLICDAVYDALVKRGHGPIPSFLTTHAPEDMEFLRRAWLTPSERRAEDEENVADRLISDRRAA